MVYIMILIIAAGVGFIYAYWRKLIKEARDFEESVNEYTENRLEALKLRISQYTTPPSIAIVQIGKDADDTEYCENYLRRAREVGIVPHWYGFEDTLADWEILQEIKDLCNHYCGLVIKVGKNSPVSGMQAHAVVPGDKNIMSLARAAGIMNFVEDMEKDGINIKVFSNNKGLAQALSSFAFGKYDSFQIQIQPAEEYVKGVKGFTPDMVELLGFIESVENALRAKDSWNECSSVSN